MEQISIIGRLGKDAQEYVNGDKPSLKFSVAVSRKGKDGAKTTNWYDVFYNGTKIQQWLTKGRQVFVQGRPIYSAYVSQVSGLPLISLTIFADQVELLSADGEQQQQAQQPLAQSAPLPKFEPTTSPTTPTAPPAYDDMQRVYGQPQQPQQPALGGMGAIDDNAGLPF